MLKKISPLLVVGSLVLAIGFVLWKAGAFNPPISPAELAQQLNANDQVVLYWGTTCPHCKATKEFIEENKITEKVNLVEKEVYENAKNQAELGKIAGFCQLDPNSVGVPFMFAEGKCYIGSPDIEAYLAKKAGLIIFTPEAGAGATPSAVTDPIN